MSTIYVGIVSDSHGRFQALEKMVDSAPDVCAWIHGGDYCDDGEELSYYTGVPVYSVMGNNDYYRSGAEAPECRSVHVGGVTFVVIHGSQWYGERREKKLLELAKEYDAQAVVFGHTHRRYLRQYNDITIMNPGSIGLPRDGKHGTFAIVSIEEGAIQNIEFKEI